MSPTRRQTLAAAAGLLSGFAGGAVAQTHTSGVNLMTPGL